MDENSIYVGRPSKWGNPFSTRIGRALAIKKFEDHLFRSGLIHDLNELANLKLFCHCHPKQCHASILIKHLYALKINEC